MASSTPYKLSFARTRTPLVLCRFPDDPRAPLGRDQFVEVNDACRALFESEEEELGVLADRILAAVPALRTAHRELAAAGEEGRAGPIVIGAESVDLQGECTVIALDGEHVLIEIHGAASSDTTELRRQLSESTEKYRQIVDQANDAIYLFEVSSEGMPARILEVNEVACRRLGYTREEYYAMDPVQLDVPGREEEIRQSLRELWENRHETVELSHRAKDGTEIPVEVSSHLFEMGNTTYHLSIVRDIRERKRAEERVRRSLKEKTVLLREIHHRVKNNMQLISSLLSLQAQSLDDPSLLDVFAEAQHRVSALALVHEKLYQAEELSHVGFSHYVSDLVRTLAEALEKPGSRYQTSIESADISLPVPTLIPLALVVSELVSNAFKHGLAPYAEGRVAISLQPDGESLVLTVADDGKGMHIPAEERESSSLGLKLVYTLAEQLDGSIHIESPADVTGGVRRTQHEAARKGTRAVLRFAAPAELKRG